MASLKRKQTLFSGVARKAKEIRQNSTNLAFDNKTNARKGSKIATADASLAIYVFYLSMADTSACAHKGGSEEQAGCTTFTDE